MEKKSRTKRRIPKKRIFFSLALLAVFGVAASVWGAATIQLTLRRPATIDDGLIAHYTFDGPDLDISSPGGGDWTEITPSAAFGPRTRAQGLVSFNGRMWLIGGWDGANVIGEVWSSADGENWTLETDTPAFGAKGTHEVLVYDNRMWVIGGGDNGVWSSTDGINWTTVTSNAGWGQTARNQHAVTVFDGRMWLIGGAMIAGGTVTDMNDVWYSTDGANWTQATSSAAWSPRQNHRVTTYDGKMWLTGGIGNEVWSSADGVSWVLETANAGWGSGIRSAHRVVVFDDKMWLIGGYNAGIPTSGVWWTEDGVNWEQATASPGWAARAEMGAVVHDNRIWVMGGLAGSTYFNDVWSTSIPGTNEVSDISGNGHHGVFMGVGDQRYSLGRIGQALGFNGVNDYVSVGDTSGSVESVSFWIRPTSAGGVIRLNSTRSISIAGGPSSFTITGGSGATIYVDGELGSTLAGGEFQHVTVNFSSGISVTDLEIGRSGANYFGGSIDDLRLYGETLSAEQIDRIYHFGATTTINKASERNNVTEGLVLHYSFDGQTAQGGSIVDVSTNGRNGTYSTTPTGPKIAPGRVGQGMLFDTPSWASTPYHTSLNVRSELTYGAWIRWNGSAGQPHNIQNIITNGRWDRAFRVTEPEHWFPNRVFLNIEIDGDIIEAYSSSQIRVGEWTHVVATYDGSEIKMYINGNQVGVEVYVNYNYEPSPSLSGLVVSGTEPTYIGAERNLVNSASYSGAVDDIRIYNRALSEEEVQRIYRAGTVSHISADITKNLTDSSLNDGLRSRWSFDGPEISGNIVNDIVGGNQGTISGGASLGIGKIGQGIHLDSPGWISVPYSESLNPRSEITYTAWIKWAGFNGQSDHLQNIITNGSWDRSLSITEVGHWNETRKLLFNTNIGGVPVQAYTVGIITAEEWTHVAATYDGSEIKLYLNGEEVDTSIFLNGSSTPTSSPALSGQIISGSSSTYIGASDAIAHSHSYSGVIDDVRIYDRALSDSEIGRLYQFGK